MQTSFKKARLITIENVEGNDEVLMEILVRLPPKFVFKFRCVSKRWNNILCDPYFYGNYRVRARNVQLCGASVGGRRLLAFIQERCRYARISVPVVRPAINMLPVIQKTEYKLNPFTCSFGDFAHSSDGLVLCYEWPRYRVVNPVTKTWVQLPLPNAGSLEYMGLVCEENMQERVPSFKVVGISVNYDRVDDNTMVIETYSSRTGGWVTSTLLGTEVLHVRRCIQQFVFSGVFYWYTGERSIIAYDSNRAENCVQLIKVPPSKPHFVTLTKPSTDDFLWAGTSYSELLLSHGCRQTIKFWKMPMNEQGSCKHDSIITEDKWILVHTIDNESLCTEIALLLGSKKRKKSSKYSTVNVMAANNLKLEALIPSNPVVAVLNHQQKIFLYNLESKALELVRYRGSPYGETRVAGWHPFMESFHLSTYGRLANNL